MTNKKVNKKASKELVTNIYNLHQAIDWQTARIKELEGLVANNAIDYQKAVKHIADNDTLTEALKAHVKLIGQRKYYKAFGLGLAIGSAIVAFIQLMGLIF